MTPQFAFSLQSQLLPLRVLTQSQTHTHALSPSASQPHRASQNNNYYNKQSVLRALHCHPSLLLLHYSTVRYCALSPQNSQNINTTYNPQPNTTLLSLSFCLPPTARPPKTRCERLPLVPAATKAKRIRNVGRNQAQNRRTRIACPL